MKNKPRDQAQKLNDLSYIKRIDEGESLPSIEYLGHQCETAWSEVHRMELPEKLRNASAIVFCGMGGSAYAARIIKSLYHNALTVPVDLVSDYHLPSYVNDRTLILAASYSGNTEETVSCINEAVEKSLPLLGISSGGVLREILERNLAPSYTFSQEYNPSLQPRLGQGYMQMGQIALLSRLGYIGVDEHDVKRVVSRIKKRNDGYGPKNDSIGNEAKRLAIVCEEKIVNIIGGEFLEGAIHAIRNPFNETGKHFANYFILPELNHHLMEGLMYPESLKENMLFLCIDSHEYTTPIRKRLALSRDVIEQNGMQCETVVLTETTKIGQVFELIQLGSYITFYLAMLHGVDPTKIPWVNYFKENLGKRE